MKSAFFKSLLISLAVILVCSAAVFAYTSFLEFDCDMTIIPATKTVKVYVDPACTQLFQPPLHIVQIEQGQTVTFDFYLRNESLVETNFYAVTTNISEVEVTWSPSAFPKLMRPDEVYKLTLYVKPSVTAVTGYKSFRITFSD